ncbi:MAG: DUF1801 domain-containing protein [Sphingomonas sp.]|uniref:DUF1801 domain-containing protein n=1 Tax=Sphingomonas sp. TaxID=28214 RepID=UPI0025D6C54E|nr:DUF1801 domain-containing protein [Sphingomonas sp.]MBX3564736.1 DUF1801 domain-containing protein [Sphingomonas sp.]
MPPDIAAYNQGQAPDMEAICDRLAAEIARALPEAESKVWHGGPVWFLAGNPIAGYWVRKQGVQLLFWSGQSFDEPGLKSEGKFKAAEAHYADAEQIDTALLQRWLEKARLIQWDYKNIVKRKGVLERIDAPAGA